MTRGRTRDLGLQVPPARQVQAAVAIPPAKVSCDEHAHKLPLASLPALLVLQRAPLPCRQAARPRSLRSRCIATVHSMLCQLAGWQPHKAAALRCQRRWMGAQVSGCQDCATNRHLAQRSPWQRPPPTDRLCRCCRSGRTCSPLLWAAFWLWAQHCNKCPADGAAHRHPACLPRLRGLLLQLLTHCCLLLLLLSGGLPPASGPVQAPAGAVKGCAVGRHLCAAVQVPNGAAAGQQALQLAQQPGCQRLPAAHRQPQAQLRRHAGLPLHGARQRAPQRGHRSHVGCLLGGQQAQQLHGRRRECGAGAVGRPTAAGIACCWQGRLLPKWGSHEP